MKHVLREAEKDYINVSITCVHNNKLSCFNLVISINGTFQDHLCDVLSITTENDLNFDCIIKKKDVLSLILKTLKV